MSETEVIASVNHPARCVFVGDGTLLIQCAEVMLARGFVVAGVASDEDAIVRWCAEHAIPRVSSADDLAAFLKGSECDYMFSVVNLRMLPAAILDIPKKQAINFHDGPLPFFAGVNTPMWALLNAAPRYGVTWHTMKADADTGNILSQSLFDVATDETQFSLNAKCFTAGIESFVTLADALVDAENKSTTLEGTAQDLSERRYFDFYDRPDAASVLDFSRPADELERFVRAHDTGAYPNPVAWPKVCVGDVAYSPQHARVCAGEDSKQDDAPPGRIVHVDGPRVRVTTSTDDLEFSAFRKLCGGDLLPGEFESAGLVVGASVAIDAATLTSLGDQAAAAARVEGRVKRRLMHPQLSLSLAKASAGDPKPSTTALTLDADVSAWIRSGDDAQSKTAGALAVFFASAASGADHVVGVPST